MGVELSSDCFLEDFGNEGQIRDGTEVIKVGRICTGFFRIGVIASVLNDEGTIPVVREEWMMAEMRGAREGRQDLTRTVGRGSS